MPLKVIVVADSRGLFLESALHTCNKKEQSSYSVVVKMGCGLLDLWAVGKDLLRQGKADLVYIYGGIMDICSRNYVDGKCYLGVTEMAEEHVTKLFFAVAMICNDVYSSCLKGKVCILPEMGADFPRYNRMQSLTYQIYMAQRNLETQLYLLRKVTYYTNWHMGCFTPEVLNCLERQSSTGRKFIDYTMLLDGMHPDSFVIKKIAEEIVSAVNIYHLGFLQ